jgi:diadenosine tetraphosphate (Ap4A) HIT family hydrolase
MTIRHEMLSVSDVSTADIAGVSQAPVFHAGCPLCQTDGGLLVVRLATCRVVRAQEAGFPAFYRVIAESHVVEWTDLPESEQLIMMRVVNIVERTLREQLHTTKINIASLGNVVPHLHWHVIARFDWDSHFPAPIWGQAQRTVEPGQLSVLAHLMPRVDDALRQYLLPW